MALGAAVDALGTTMRVLMIGAHPDDEDTNLIAWLARGQHVETAYLSLTRGDGGQNLIGNELGEALGVVRTEELLAARRIDGGHQFFTRAYDFGFSKSAEETYQHWPKDSILGDVVEIVRAFRPHVVVAVFSGTPRDGHGHHQVSGMLAREAYDVAGDSVRYPASRYGAPWLPLKFYRAARFDPDAGTLRMNVGEYDPLLGRSYAELAGLSRSQHKSQGFGALQRKGTLWDYVRREATRVNEATAPAAETSLFAGIDTTLAGAFTAGAVPAPLRELPALLASARSAANLFDLEASVGPLVQIERRTRAAAGSPVAAQQNGGTESDTRSQAVDAPDASAILGLATRAQHALQVATGVALEALAERELLARGDSLPVTVTLYNRGRRPVRVTPDGRLAPAAALRDTVVLPDSALQWTAWARGDSITQPWWLARPRAGDLFAVPASTVPEDERAAASGTGATARAMVTLDGAQMLLTAPVVYRYADAVRGEVSRPLATVPAVSVTLERAVQYARAHQPIDRSLRVRVQSANATARDVTVRLQLPAGLTADSAARTVRLDGYDAARVVTFRLRGTLAPGRHVLRVTAESGGETFATGYQLVDYDHIRPQRLYRPAEVRVEAVDVRVPAGHTVAYVSGVGDEIAPMLRDLGLPVSLLEPAALATADLSGYSAVVIGPRAFQASPAVLAANRRLLDYARRGGTLVVQYQQNEIVKPGVAPYALTLARRAERVTLENAPVAIVEPAAAVLRAPNAITAADFDGWVQERASYMPSSFAPEWTAPLAMHDPGEPPNRGAILVAPVGRGTYVYTTLAFFRQLPAGVPGAARLFVNLLEARATPGAARASAGTR